MSFKTFVKDLRSPEMHTFTRVWMGQLVSMLGSALTNFAMAVYVLQTTGSATAFGWVMFFGFLPGILVTLISGVLADRWDRRRQMIMADVIAMASSLFVATLYLTGSLQLWHIYIAVAVTATAGAIQAPAWGAMAVLLVPKDYLTRVGGMNSMARSVVQIGAPLVGGALMVMVGLGGVILVDFATFLFGMACTLSVKFPPVPESEGAKKAKGSVLREARYGWAYVWNFVSLRTHLMWFACLNFVLSFLWVLFPALILGFTDARGFGIVSACFGVGTFAGGLAMTTWGGPKRRVYGLLFGGVMAGIGMAGVGLRPSVPIAGFFLFALTFGLPILNGCFYRMWLPRIPADLQGRAMAAMLTVSWSSQPIAFLLAGPIADRVFRPLLVEGGPLAGTVGLVLGTGPARGIGLLLVIGGVVLLALTAIVALIPAFYSVEETIPEIVAGPTLAPEPAKPEEEPEEQPVGEGALPLPA